MPQKQIKTVRLERQAHKDAMNRLQMAYQALREAAKQASQVSEIVQKPASTIEEVNSCQEVQPYPCGSPPADCRSDREKLLRLPVEHRQRRHYLALTRLVTDVLV